MQPPWKTVWSFFKKLKTELPYDPAIPLQGMYPKKSGPHRRICIPVFCSAVPSSRMRPQPGCLSIDKCTKKMPDTHTHTHTHTHTQWSLTQPLKKRNPPFKTTWVKLEDIMSSKVSQTQTGKCSRSSLSVESKTDSEKRRRT